jgi:hypothetical protein
MEEDMKTMPVLIHNQIFLFGILSDRCNRRWRKFGNALGPWFTDYLFYCWFCPIDGAEDGG